jgi:hypothetical protein
VPCKPPAPGGDRDQPFLIGPDGRVLAAKYGKYVDDQWSVEELLDLARHR